MPINPELMAMMGGQAMGPAPQMTLGGGGGGPDWDLIAMMLGQGAQAFSAGDPTSWQYGIGGMASRFAQSRKFAKAATTARREERGLTQQLIDIMRGGVSPQGIPGLTSMKISPKGEMMFGVTPERGAYDDMFGMEPLALSGMDVGTAPGGEGPLEVAPRGMEYHGGAPESLIPGGAGGRSAIHPFFQSLPEVGSQRPIW